MAIIFIRSTVIYVVLLIIMRFMGKRQIGEMQPFELVVTLLIAELACIPMSDVSIPLSYGISAILATFILHQIFAMLEQKGAFFKVMLSGKPSLVINKNGVNFKELKRNNLDIFDLVEALRSAGYYSIDSVDYAIYESNGTLTAVESETESKQTLPIIIIQSGKFVLKNLNIIKFSKQEFIDFLKEKENCLLKEVGVFTVDGNGNYYIQKEGEKFTTGTMSLKEGVKW